MTKAPASAAKQREGQSPRRFYVTTLTPFTFPATGQQVRTVTSDGEPWFVAKDACDVIGISKYRDAVAQLDEDERASMAVDTLGGKQRMVVVNEPGLYGLMLISRSPKVKPFRRWVTHEVLPAIRKTGSYSTAPAVPASFADALELAAKQAREIEALAPAAEHWNVLASGDGDRSVREAAQILDRDPAIEAGEKRLFAYLRTAGWIGPDNQPYQAQVDNGRLARRMGSYEHPRTGEQVPTSQLRITAKGIAELRKRLGGAS